MIKKLLAFALSVAMIMSITALPVAFAEESSGKVVYYEENFDAYDLGDADSVTVNAWDSELDSETKTELLTADGKKLSGSISISRNNQANAGHKIWSYSVANITDKEGNPTQAFRASSVVAPDTTVTTVGGSASASSTNCTYWTPVGTSDSNMRFYVYKVDFMAGGDGFSMPSTYGHEPNNISGASGLKPTYLRGATFYPFNSSSVTTTVSNGSWYEWKYILDTQENKAYGYLDGALVQEVALTNATFPENLLAAPNGPSEKVGGSAKAITFDNILAYGAKGVSVTTFPANGAEVKPRSTVTVTLTQGAPLVEGALDSIKLLDADGTEVTLAGRDYNSTTGVYTLSLEQPMAEFSSYTLDLSGLVYEFGIPVVSENVSFVTSGEGNFLLDQENVTFSKVNLLSEGGATEITALQSGLITCNINAVNETTATLNAVAIAVLKKDGQVEMISYQDKSMAEAETFTFKVGFNVPEEETDKYSIEVFVWKDLSGSETYSDKIVFNSQGVATIAKAEQ